MPRIDPEKTGRTAPKPKPVKRRKVVVVVPDRRDPTRSRRMPTVTPDQADRQRPAAQQRRDKVVVARNVRESREKVVSKRGRGAGTRAVQKVILAPIRVQQGNQKVVSPAEARKLRAQGKTVRVQTRAERNDIGATQRSIGGGGTLLTRAPLAVGYGIAQDPKKALPATARGFRDALTGIPSSIASLISDPVGTLEQSVQDYGRRYGELGKPGGVQKTADRISKEGAAPELLDATILVGGVGGAGGRALTRPAAAGKLGAKAKAVATEARPDKRVSGGTTVPQDKSPNLIVAANQRRRDTRKVQKNQRRVAVADEKGQRVDAVKQLAAQKGEIPVSGRKARRIVAREKGRDLERMKREQVTEVDRGTRKALNSLSKAERAGFAVAMKLGIPADPVVARRVMEKRRQQIAEAREKEGVVVPKVLRKSNDELAILGRLIEDADNVFTPKLRQIVEVEQARERRVAANDPGLDETQAELSRVRAQAGYLGIERGDRPAVRERRLVGEETRQIVETIDPETRQAAAKAVARYERRTGRKATSDQKRAIRREATKRAAQYDPTPEGIAAQTFYHGTGTKGLSPERLDSSQTSIESIFGEGVYLTAKPGIARGYAKARGRKTKAPAIYKAKVRPGGVLDLEAKADPKVVAILEKHAENMGYVPYEGVTHEIRDAVRAAAKKPGATNEDVFDALRAAVGDHSHTYEKSSASYSENYTDISGDLRAAGYDVLTHIGGKRTGHKPHQVVIALDPADVMGSGRANPVSEFAERRSAKGPPKKVDTSGAGNRKRFKPNSRPEKNSKGERVFASGRGAVDKDGRLHTWYEAEATHAELGFTTKNSGTFMIGSDGTIRVHNGGGGMSDAEIVARAMAQDSRLKSEIDPASRPMRWSEEIQTYEDAPSINDHLARIRPEYERRSTPDDPRVPTSRPAGSLTVRRYENPAVKPGGPETDAEYLQRVREAAEAEGLATPGYFHSQKRPRAGNADRAIGGARAVADPKKYTGALFRTGREDNSPIVQEQAIARNIKRKWNWNLVAKNFDKHTFDWSRDKSVSQLLDEFDKRGIDPESVALWNPRRYYAARQAAEAENAAGTDLADLDSPRGEEPTVRGLDAAVDGSAVKISDIAEMAEREGISPDEFVKSKGWSVVPKAIYEEIHADTRPSGAIMRGWDIAKGKQARIMLGLSPAWLQFQIASNAILSGLAGTGPVDLAKANVWWNKLPDEQKAAIEPFIGTGAFQDSIQQTKLGAARTRSEKVNQMIDAYRAMKTTPFMQKVGRGNPLDMLFRFDAAQNNAFRKGVLYSQIKRDAYKRMGENTKRMAGLQTRFMHTLNLGPEKIMDEIANNPRDLERHAQYVNDMLGDYQTYTATERRGLSRATMFYGFLRFSLRFAFMTMPIKHPVMSAIIAQLGRMQTDEVRKLLGGDELPWALGKFYYTKDGQLKSVDLSRANPAMNGVTNFRAPKDVLGFLPPIAGAVIDQFYAKSGFKQREWEVEGENQPRSADQGYGVENRVRIFLNQMFSLAAPYRAAVEATQPGPKGNDTLLGSPRPTGYKDPQTVYSIAASVAKKPQTVEGRLAQQFLPFVPRNDDAPELAASIRARNGEETDAAPRSVAPAPSATPAGPMTREQAQMELRRRMSRRASGGANAAQMELRRRMSRR